MGRPAPWHGVANRLPESRRIARWKQRSEVPEVKGAIYGRRVRILGFGALHHVRFIPSVVNQLAFFASRFTEVKGRDARTLGLVMVTVSAAWTTWPSNSDVAGGCARWAGNLRGNPSPPEVSEIRQPWELGPLFEVQSDEVHAVRRAGRDQGVERPTFLFGLEMARSPARTAWRHDPRIGQEHIAAQPPQHFSKSAFWVPPNRVALKAWRASGVEWPRTAQKWARGSPPCRRERPFAGRGPRRDRRLQMAPEPSNPSRIAGCIWRI